MVKMEFGVYTYSQIFDEVGVCNWWITQFVVETELPGFRTVENNSVRIINY
jgi:hypothetical protein